MAAATFCGLGLRLAAARGDLWQDELWSLDLVSHITSPDQVFWNISHDNNHFLNSLWMYCVGQHAAPMLYRLPSVLFSTLAILVAARIGGRVNAAAAVAAASLAACSYPFVDYGSEARGYGGLILAILAAIDLSTSVLNRMLDVEPGVTGVPPQPADTGSLLRSWRWLLAVAILFGACAHLTMFVEAAILGLAAILRLKIAGRPIRRALDEAIDLFRPTLLLLLPLIAVMGLGIVVQHGFTVGGVLPFTAERFLRGYGGLLKVLLGLPFAAPNWTAIVVAAAVIGGGWLTGLLDRRWFPLAMVAMVVWPTAAFLARVPNTEHARYFLTAGLLLPIVLAEIAGRLWARGGLARFAGITLVGAVCAGQVPALIELIVDHRGAPASAVLLMASHGSSTFRARNGMATDPVIDVYATQLGFDLKPADQAEPCRKPADWMVYDADHGEAAPDGPITSAQDCGSHYGKVQTFPAPLWSGRSWTIYRRVP